MNIREKSKSGERIEEKLKKKKKLAWNYSMPHKTSKHT